MSAPLNVFLKHSVVDASSGRTASIGRLYLAIWLTSCLVTVFRATATFSSLSSSCRVERIANRLAAQLSLLVAFIHFTGSIICGNCRQLLLAMWCILMGLVNLMVERKLHRNAPPALRRMPVRVESPLEIDHFTHNLQRWGTACVVCLDNFEEEEKVARLPCGHNFHEKCLRQWLRRQKQCPYRCSADAAQKRKRWEATELEAGEHELQSDYEGHVCTSLNDEEGEVHSTYFPGRSSGFLCTC